MPSPPGNPGRVKLSFLVGLALFATLVGLAIFARRPLPPPVSPILGQVKGFVLTNQAGVAFSSAELTGRVWVADIVFTRCPGPCPRMTAHLAELQRQLSETGDVHLVTLTADPQHDTPEVLAGYARQFEADTNRWHFLTGPAANIYRVATEQLLLAVGKNPEPESAAPEDLFLHSTKLVLVDGEGRLRGVFDGEDPAVVGRLLAAIERLTSGALRSSGGS